MPHDAFAVHGLSREFLADKPRFAELADEFLTFIADARLVIHNAGFDMRFLNAELARLKKAALCRSTASSTRWRWRGAAIPAPGCRSTSSASVTASTIRSGSSTAPCSMRRSWPRSISSLPVAARRRSASLPTAVTISLSPSPAAAPAPGAARAAAHAGGARHQPPSSRARRGGAVASLSGLMAAFSGLAGRLRLHFGQTVAIERDEVDRVEHQRRIAAIARRVGDDLSREREHQARALRSSRRHGRCRRGCRRGAARRRSAART